LVNFFAQERTTAREFPELSEREREVLEHALGHRLAEYCIPIGDGPNGPQ
jgi:hypothetical protein